MLGLLGGRPGTHGFSHQITVNSMRMIGIGLLGFLLAGIALLLSTMNIVEQGQQYVRQITDEPELVFENRRPAVSNGPHRAVIARGNPDTPVILSGLPAYQSVAFMMPVDARPTSGYLQIDATSQVLDGVEGVLRISIHNSRRGEMLLRSGIAERTLQIPLSPMDFAGSQLVVSFSLQGTGPQHQCAQDGGIEAVVEIETTSALYLTLDRPLQSAQDRVHAWGNVVRVAWPDWLKPDEQVRRLVLATQFKQRKMQTLFEPDPNGDALTTVDLREALPAFDVSTDLAPVFPRPLVQSGANVGLRRFHRQVVWRERYHLQDSADQRVPSHLDLHLVLGRLMGSHAWQLTVTLNNRLVFQDNVPGTQATFRALMELPADIQTSNNQIEIVAASNASTPDTCNRGPELVAELLPQAQLIPGEATYQGPISQIRAALSGIDPLAVAIASPLTAVQADMASNWLSQTAPPGVRLKPAQVTAHIMVRTTDSPAMTLEHGAWLVVSGGETDALVIQYLAPGSVVPRARLALLIVPAGINMLGIGL